MSVKASLLPQGRYANANTKKIKEAKKIKEEGGGHKTKTRLVR